MSPKAESIYYQDLYRISMPVFVLSHSQKWLPPCRKESGALFDKREMDWKVEDAWKKKIWIKRRKKGEAEVFLEMLDLLDCVSTCGKHLYKKQTILPRRAPGFSAGGPAGGVDLVYFTQAFALH